MDAFVFWLLVALLQNFIQPTTHKMTSCAVIARARQIVPT